MATRTGFGLAVTVVGLTLGAGTAWGQLVRVASEPETPAVSKAGDDTAGHGRMLFFETTEDAGEVFDTDPVPMEFKFRNTGGGPLTITRVQPTCGCTVPELEKTVFEPNEVGTIKVVFDPRGRQGPVSRAIQVFTDSTQTPSMAITVRAHVKPVVVAMPHDVLNFESVDKGTEVVREVRVLGRFPEFEVTRASTTEPALYDVEVVPVGSAEIDGDTLYEHVVRVTLKKTAPPGQYNASLSIRTNDEKRPIMTVATVARIAGDLEISPVRMTLGRLTVGQEFEREVRVRNRKGVAFEIEGAVMTNPSVAAEYTFEPVDPETRTEWIVRAKGRVVSTAPRLNATLNLRTDVKGEEMTGVQVTGVLRPN